MRGLLLTMFVALLLLASPALFAQHDTASPTDSSGGSAAHGAEAEAHKVAHSDEAPHTDEGHAEKKYFGIPGWILKTLNMILFIGVLVYFVGGPVKKAFAERSAAIRRAADEARERREKSDRMADDIQARLAAIESEVRAIHERAQVEGERQKRELITAAEAESQKILQAARNEVDNRLKHARAELTEFAGELAAQRAEQLLREKMTEQDQKKLFEESLREVGGVNA
jgi:F-type H+-transporting ATPase subunit b